MRLRRQASPSLCQEASLVPHQVNDFPPYESKVWSTAFLESILRCLVTPREKEVTPVYRPQVWIWNPRVEQCWVEHSQGVKWEGDCRIWSWLKDIWWNILNKDGCTLNFCVIDEFTNRFIKVIEREFMSGLEPKIFEFQLCYHCVLSSNLKPSNYHRATMSLLQRDNTLPGRVRFFVMEMLFAHDVLHKQCVERV